MKPLSKNKKIILIAVVAGLAVTGLTCLFEANTVYPIMHGLGYVPSSVTVLVHLNESNNVSQFSEGSPDPICHLSITHIITNNNEFTVSVGTVQPGGGNGFGMANYYVSLYEQDSRVDWAMIDMPMVLMALGTPQQLCIGNSHPNRGLPFTFINFDRFIFDILSFALDFILFFVISLLIVWLGYYYKAWKARRYQQFKQQPPQVLQQPPFQTLAKRRR
jgi:hypothetical protein